MKHLVALLNSHIEGDDERFLSVALQVAATEAREGRTEEAERLRDLVQKARDQRRNRPVTAQQTPIPLARPKGELSALVGSAYPKIRLSDMVLAEGIAKRLKRVIREQQMRAKLRDNGRIPTTHMLLAGLPGTGKTMTASALAGELHLPLFTVNLDALFSKFLGETAGKLRLLFDQIAQVRGVYLLDEFDAIGSSRSATNDIGEIRRILNSVLVYMEEPNATDSLVIAASNHAELLDGALARRFDEVVMYDLPDAEAAKAVLTRRLGHFKLTARAWTGITKHTEGLSQAELTRAADVVVKAAILDGASKISAASLKDALEDRRAFRSRFIRKR